MRCPRPKGRVKKRLSLEEVKNLQARNIVIPNDVRVPLERTGRRDLQEYARDHGWLIVPMVGNEFLKGYPDTIWHHKQFGIRHVETKSSRGKLRTTQIEMFMKLEAHGTGVWVLEHAGDYPLIFKEPNWHFYLERGV